MLHNVLSAVADKTRDVSIGESVFYAALGFASVFIGIAFLILVVWLVGKGMNKGTAVKQQPKAVEQAPLVQPTSPTEEVEEEIVAVITAAVTAYYQEHNPKCEFTVKRIKRM